MKSWVTFAIWLIVVGGGIYFPFVRSPEMTNSQLMINYWWFYLPALVGIATLTVFNHSPKRRTRR